MRVGIFAKTFARPTVEATLDAVEAHGFDGVQFNLSCVGLPTLPDSIPDDLIIRIRDAHKSRGLEMFAVSGTFNLIHPDLEVRRDGLRRLDVLASAAHGMGTSIITLCSGTRDPDNMWRHHPENASESAWHDLLRSLEEALAVARRHNVTLGIEPEISNVVSDIDRSRKLLDLFSDEPLGIVLDPANLLRPSDLPRMRDIMQQAFDTLGNDLILAHAKDISRYGHAGDVPPGKGMLDYPFYLQLLRQALYDGPMILHGLEEAAVTESFGFLLDHLLTDPEDVDDDEENLDA